MVSCKVPRVIVIGGGAAGFFGAIACAENTKDDVDIRIFEKSSKFLSKVARLTLNAVLRGFPDCPGSPKMENWKSYFKNHHFVWS